jgi:hypothetical protein
MGSAADQLATARFAASDPARPSTSPGAWAIKASSSGGTVLHRGGAGKATLGSRFGGGYQRCMSAAQPNMNKSEVTSQRMKLRCCIEYPDRKYLFMLSRTEFSVFSVQFSVIDLEFHGRDFAQA